MFQPHILASSCLSILLCLTAPTYGDEPPSWEEFDVSTRDDSYCAEIRRVSTTETRPSDAVYWLRVFSRSGDSPGLFWSKRYQYDGYPEGVLTDDGRRFVYVSHWYHLDRPVVRIVSETGDFTLNGKAFELAMSSLRRTVSHELWLADTPKPFHLVDVHTLAISTRDGGTYRIDLRTGRLSP